MSIVTKKTCAACTREYTEVVGCFYCRVDGQPMHSKHQCVACFEKHQGWVDGFEACIQCKTPWSATIVRHPSNPIRCHGCIASNRKSSDVLTKKIDKMPLIQVNARAKARKIVIELHDVLITGQRSAVIFTTTLALPDWVPYTPDTNWRPDDVRQSLLEAAMAGIRDCVALEQVETIDGVEYWGFGT